MKVVIVGAGPSGLFCSLLLLEKGYEVHLFERGAGVGKKLLVAGKSGLNITHSEDISSFKKKYFDHELRFEKLLSEFSNEDLCRWLASLGISTFVGTSGRVFPKEFKAATLLKAIVNKLDSFEKFHLNLNSKLEKIEKNYVVINEQEIHFDKIVYALGGASWPRLGTDGAWASLFGRHHIKINQFYAINCGLEISWSDIFLAHAQNVPVKNVVLQFDSHRSSGDIMLTPYGIEGTPAYTLSYYIQKASKGGLKTKVSIDLVPDLSLSEIQSKLEKRNRKDSLSNVLRKQLNLPKSKVKLFFELNHGKIDFTDLGKRIKKCDLFISKTRPIDEAISTGGGIDFDELTDLFELKKLPGHYVMGEMIDWVAPTGGYLLQGCFSQAHWVAQSI